MVKVCTFSCLQTNVIKLLKTAYARIVPFRSLCFDLFTQP